MLCHTLPWALVAYCLESWTLALLIPLVVGLAVLVAEYQVTLGTLRILVSITSERCCPCLGLGSGCSEWKSKSGTQPHILSSCIMRQCSYANAVMHILVCPGNGDNGEAGLAKTPVNTIFVEVYELIYLICGLKHQNLGPCLEINRYSFPPVLPCSVRRCDCLCMECLWVK